MDRKETVYAKIDPAAFRMRVALLSERRPETYLALARHVAPWNVRASTAPRSIEAIVVQYRPRAGKVTENGQLVDRMLAKRLGDPQSPDGSAHGPSASEPGVRLIVLPELSLIGRARAIYGRNLIGPFIVSMTHDAADLLAVLLMATIPGCRGTVPPVPPTTPTPTASTAARASSGTTIRLALYSMSVDEGSPKLKRSHTWRYFVAGCFFGRPTCFAALLRAATHAA